MENRNIQLYKKAINLAKEINDSVPVEYVPPSEGTIPKSQMLLPHSMVKNTRGYIERITYQINGTYEQGWYDSCAVMIRRLIETLIIELFEHFNIDSKIKNTHGNFFYLSDLISITVKDNAWNLGRNTKAALPKLKNIGDFSAHSRRYIAHREDIDKIQQDVRIVVQELLFLSKLK